MTLTIRKISAFTSLTLLSVIFTACSQNASTASQGVSQHTSSETATKTAQKDTEFKYISMEGFNPAFGKFVGLEIGETFAQSEPKINAVFKAYQGHEEPVDIRMNSTIVEAGWKQVLVTQDGLMDRTVAGQQLLAIYDENEELVTYGMRIKCHTTGGGVSEWRSTICE